MIWSRPEIRVLFICTANICRSPLAEGMLRHRLRALKLGSRVQVASAGTQAMQGGCRPDPRIEELAVDAGVSLSGIRARMLTVKLLARSDYVLVMEHRHLEEISRLCAGESVQFATQTSARTHLLGSFIPDAETAATEIPDPYFGHQQGFYHVYQMIDLALSGLMTHIHTRLHESGPRKH